MFRATAAIKKKYCQQFGEPVGVRWHGILQGAASSSTSLVELPQDWPRVTFYFYGTSTHIDAAVLWLVKTVLVIGPQPS